MTVPSFDAPAPSRFFARVKDSVTPIVRAEKALLVADDFELDTGIWLEPCHGHSAGHVVVNLASGDDRAVVTGDVIRADGLHAATIAQEVLVRRVREDRDA